MKFLDENDQRDESETSDEETISCEEYMYEQKSGSNKENLSSINQTSTANMSGDHLKNYISQDATNTTQNALHKNSTQDSFTESDFLKILQKTKTTQEKPKTNYVHNKIYKNMRIIAKEKLELRRLKYYKFPLYIIKRDENKEWFDFWLNEWKKAFISIYKNFRDQNQKFYILYYNCVCLFEDGRVITDKNLKNKLDENEIEYKMSGEYSIVTGIDVALFFDSVINANYHKIGLLPLILSYEEFENGSMYYTNIKKETSVLYKNEISYYYFVDGYFYGGDYKNLFDNEITFDM